ncbi:hypothetical protein BH11ARM2_BH11ARM2_06970 [soil metagenome]
MEAETPQSAPRKPWLPGQISREARREIVGAIVDGAFATRRFYILLALATTIAAFGLLSNSTAVIIGAMIVAPLMGPILGLSLGMVTGHPRLEKGAIVAEVTGVAMAVALGYAAGCIPLNLGPSAEMMARTAPNTFDLGIAFASGLAGAYVSVNRKVNSAIAGVAISVALVPPLATCGLLLAMGHGSQAMGAFLLFGANFFSIQLAAALVFGLYGFARTWRRAHSSLWPLIARFMPGVLSMILMAWGMTGTLVSLVREHNQDVAVRRVLSDELARRSGGQLEEILRQKFEGGEMRIVASTLTPQVYEPSHVAAMETALGKVLGQRVRLILRSVVSQDVDDHGRVFLTDEEREQSQQAKDDAEYLSEATNVLREGLKEIKGAELDGVDRRDQDGTRVLVALVRGPLGVTPEQTATLEETLQQKLGEHLRLIVRNVATQDVDRQGFLYVAKPEEAPQPDPAVERLRERVRDVLQRRMATRPARSLDELQLEPAVGLFAVRAVVSATLPVRPSEVAAIETDLRRFLDPRLRLRVQTVLRAEASSIGWSPPP